MNEFEGKKNVINFFRENKDGFISGEEVSGALGVSRACVWKYIKKLRDDGYVIEAVPHLGYRLKSSPDKMYGYDISSGLRTEVIGKKNAYYYESIGSTNDKAYELAENGEPEGVIVLAETQLHGKGRMGRKWESPDSDGIYMSLILRPDAETDEVPAVTLIAAAAVIRAMNRMYDLEARMKWPNDVWIKDRKVCGILTEIKAQPDMVDFVVLGIGVNVNTDPKRLPPGSTSLRAECCSRVNRMEFLKKFRVYCFIQRQLLHQMVEKVMQVKKKLI